MADEIIVRLRGEGVDDFIKKLKESGAEVSDLGKKTDKQTKKMSKSFSSLKGFVAGALSTAAIVEFSKAISRLATDVDATNAKFKTVFGDAGRIVDDFAKKSARSLGLTTNEFRKASAAIGDLLVPLGFQRSEAAKLSSELVKLSGSLAKWDTQQRSSIQIADILSKALLGEREQLKSLGVNIQEADVKQRLFEKGQKDLEGTALQQAKALATLELITEKTGDAQAAAADDTETLREKQLQLGASVRQLAQDLVERLTPAYGKLLDLLNGALENNPAQKILQAVRDQAETITKVELDNQRELLESRREELELIKEAGQITFRQAVELKNTIPAALKEINKIEEERTRLVGARRGGATDEQRAQIEEQKRLDAALKAEQERLRLQKEQEEAAKAAEKAAKELEKIIKKGLVEIRNGVLGFEEQTVAELDVKVNLDFEQTWEEKVKAELDKAIQAIEESELANIDDVFAVPTSDADRELEKYWEDFADRAKKAEEKLRDEREATKEVSIAAATKAFDVTSGFIDNELARLQNALEAGDITRKEYDKRRSELLEKQAKADKANAVFEIGLNTAQAVTKALTAGPVAGPILAAVVAGLAAAELAQVLSAPIPQFAKGTKGSRTAPEGFAWVGEEGPELVQMKGGEKVITAGDSEQLMKMLGGYGIPVQFKSSYEQLYKPMSAMNELAKGTPLEGIDWNPLLRSNDVGRRTSARKLDAIHDQLVRLNHGLSRRMTRA